MQGLDRDGLAVIILGQVYDPHAALAQPPDHAVWAKSFRGDVLHPHDFIAYGRETPSGYGDTRWFRNLYLRETNAVTSSTC